MKTKGRIENIRWAIVVNYIPNSGTEIVKPRDLSKIEGKLGIKQEITKKKILKKNSRNLKINICTYVTFTILL